VAFGCAFNVVLPTWHQIRVSYTRPIVLKEAESLQLYFAWERMMSPLDVTRLAQPPMMFAGGIRMLLES
jgi:hypothetical protein